MPEGPEIRLAADRVERAIVDRPASRVYFAFPRLKRYQRRLAGERVAAVDTRGKAMLIRFANGLVVYSHNQLYGRWYVVKAGRVPRTNRTLRLAIHNEEHSALLYSASEIDVLPEEEVEQHPFIAKLGPDALDDALSDAALARRLADPRFARRQLAALLLDQGFVAGIGNYLRSEILFVAGVHPALRPGELDRGQRQRLAKSIRRVARQSYRTKGITNDPKRVARLKAEGLTRSRYRHHVFARGGLPCWTCRSEIERSTLGGRQLFVCPSCQSAPERSAAQPARRRARRRA
ncbi:MAG: endonuclease VIII [Myxococcota bacterium]|nr:endonuclease VIII [Myxococcota bacterium]